MHRRIHRTRWATIHAAEWIYAPRNMSEMRNSVTWVYRSPIDIAILLMLRRRISRHCSCALAHSLQCLPGGSLCAIAIRHSPLPSARHSPFAIRHCLRLAIRRSPFAIALSFPHLAFTLHHSPSLFAVRCSLFAVRCLLFPFTYAVSSLQPVSLILPSQWLPSPVWFSLALGCSRLPPRHGALFDGVWWWL
jgi:hypothetical protein